MIRIEEMKEALGIWLGNCPCELCGEQEKNYLYLAPVLLKFRSVSSFLSRLRGKFEGTEQLIVHLQNIIRQDSGQYDYKKIAPILCKGCTQKAGLEVNEGYRMAYPPSWVCEQCGKTWDSLQDSTRGAGLKIGEQLLCEGCALTVLKERGALKEKAQDKRKRKYNRECNDAFQDEYLEGKQCEKCGESEFSLLTLRKISSSPKGTIAQWRRDCSSETFEQRIRDCKIICQKCSQNNNDQNEDKEV